MSVIEEKKSVITSLCLYHHNYITVDMPVLVYVGVCGKQCLGSCHEESYVCVDWIRWL